MTYVLRKHVAVGDETLGSKQRLKTYEETLKELFPETGKRRDGRSWSDHRPLYMKTGMQTEARGSAFVEMGRTKVVVSVHGPLETNARTLEEEGFIAMSLRFAPFSSRDVCEGAEPTEDNHLMYRIRKTIDTVLCRHEFPNCHVPIEIMILEDDGGVFEACVAATSLALADARLPMFDLVAAVNIGCHGDMMLVDLTKEEEKFCKNSRSKIQNSDWGKLNFAFVPNMEEFTEYSQEGAMSLERLESASDIAVGNIKAIVRLQQQVLGKDIKASLSDTNSALYQAFVYNKTTE